MTKKRNLLTVPVEPFEVVPQATAEEILLRMERISFQGRNLGTAHKVWKKMLADQVLIFLGIAGALSAGGLRMIIAYLITNRFVDCLVSTGANLYHDLHETRGGRHFLGTPVMDDELLRSARIDRVYDTLVSEDEFIDNDNWIAEFARTLKHRQYTSREFLYLLGGHLWNETKREGILTSAYRSRVPIFCPGIADSSIGMGLSQASHLTRGTGHINVIGDIIESTNLVINNPRTASVVIGGGTPKNFINQASVQADFYRGDIKGHHYALQIVTDVPHFGGASGSTLDEAKSWGKISRSADQVTVNVDATIALPLLVSGLASSANVLLTSRKPSSFDLSTRMMAVDGVRFSSAQFLKPAMTSPNH